MNLVWNHYRTGFHNDFFTPVSDSEAVKKRILVRGRRARKKTVVGLLWLGWMAIKADYLISSKSGKMQKNLVKHFFKFFSE
jgi:hypothetical protein